MSRGRRGLMTRHAPAAAQAQVTNYQPLERFLLRAGRNQKRWGMQSGGSKDLFLDHSDRRDCSGIAPQSRASVAATDAIIEMEIQGSMQAAHALGSNIGTSRFVTA